IITGTAGWTRDNYVFNIERDTNWTAGVKAEWRLTREFAVKASFMHTQETSNVPGRAFAENTYLVGMRMQYCQRGSEQPACYSVKTSNDSTASNENRSGVGP